jgi:hypothetical protein
VQGIIILIIGVLLFLFAWYILKKGNAESIWITLLEAIHDVFFDLVFTNTRIWALLIGLVGFVMILFGTISLYKLLS